MNANPIYKFTAGAPFQPGDRVRVVSLQLEDQDSVEEDSRYLEQVGVVKYLEYTCGCGQSFPDDPMIGVVFDNLPDWEFWRNELAFEGETLEMVEEHLNELSWLDYSGGLTPDELERIISDETEPWLWHWILTHTSLDVIKEYVFKHIPEKNLNWRLEMEKKDHVFVFVSGGLLQDVCLEDGKDVSYFLFDNDLIKAGECPFCGENVGETCPVHGDLREMRDISREDAVALYRRVQSLEREGNDVNL